jgi:hypothetical protein
MARPKSNKIASQAQSKPAQSNSGADDFIDIGEGFGEEKTTPKPRTVTKAVFQKSKQTEEADPDAKYYVVTPNGSERRINVNMVGKMQARGLQVIQKK